MEQLLPFLKKYSDVDTEFIKKFIEIRTGDNVHAPFSIDLGIVAEWLKTRKEDIKKTILKSYKKDIDYILLRPRSEQKSKGRGGHNEELILLTPDTFKMLTMKSKTIEAQKVRYYYVTLEKLVEIYKDDIIKKQNEKIGVLERNLKKTKYPVRGSVYIINVSDDEGFGIGKTKDMNLRIKGYDTHHKDKPEVVYIFYTHDIHRLEKCVKLALQDFEYRRNKEYYKASKSDIIEAIKDCEHLITKFKSDDNKTESIKDLSRHKKNNNNKENIIFTTKIKYDNALKGGQTVISNNKIIYNLNKCRYLKLNILNI